MPNDVRQVLVFNCDEGIDFQSMGRIFIGLVKVYYYDRPRSALLVCDPPRHRNVIIALWSTVRHVVNDCRRWRLLKGLVPSLSRKKTSPAVCIHTRAFYCFAHRRQCFSKAWRWKDRQGCKFPAPLPASDPRVSCRRNTSSKHMFYITYTPPMTLLRAD